MITAPGIYDIPDDTYHADPCPKPSLSHSIAKILLNHSPLRAKYAHPRLVPQPEAKEANDGMRRGQALHKMILGKGADITVCNYADWRKNDAKDERAAALKAGNIPLLFEDYDYVRAAATAALEQMHQHPDLAGFFEDGQSEAVIAWEESGIWCRGMIDRLPANPRWPSYDLKFTGMSADPDEFSRRFAKEYATQDAFYRRGLEKLRGVMPPPQLFIIIEDEPPFDLSVITSAPSLEYYANAEMDRAVHLWSECMRTGVWPGYPKQTAYIECPAWMAIRQGEKAARAEHSPIYQLAGE